MHHRNTVSSRPGERAVATKEHASSDPHSSAVVARPSRHVTIAKNNDKNDDKEDDKKDDKKDNKWDSWLRGQEFQFMTKMGMDICTAELEPKTFPMDDPKINGINQIILLTGKRRSGKSYWIRDYLYTYRHYFPYGFIFTKTKNNGWYQKFFPNWFIFEEYNEDLIHKIVTMQQQRVLLTGVNANIFILFDDFAAESTNRIQSFLRFAMYGRHWNCTCLFATQRLTLASAALRNNADKIVIFYCPDRNLVKTIYEECAGEWRSEMDFRAFLSRHTTDNNSIVIDLKSNEARGSGRVYKYKARDLDDTNFSLLCDQAWGGKNMRGQILKQQRAEWVKPDYSMATLERYGRNSKISSNLLEGDTSIMKQLDDEDFELARLVVPDGEADGHSKLGNDLQFF